MASGDFPRGEGADISVREVAERLAIRELVDAYSFCADRRDAAGQMALFTEDTDFLVYMDSRNPSPTQEIRGRAALAPVFDDLNTFVKRGGTWFFSQRKLMVDWTETRPLGTG